MKVPGPLSRVTALLALQFVSVSLVGCSYIRAAIINKQWPPLDPTAEQEKAIQASELTLSGLPQVDLYAGVTTADLNTYLPPILLQSPQLIGLKSISFSTGLQDVIATGDYQGAITAPFAASFLVTATIHSFPYIDNSDLVLRPILSTVHVHLIKINGTPLTGWETIINQALKAFLANINGQLAAQRISLRLGAPAPILPATYFKNLPDVTDTWGNPIPIDATLGTAVILVDNIGLHAVARLSQNKSPVPPTAPAQPAPSSPSEDFARFKATFLKVGGSIGEDIGTDLWQGTSAAISKDSVTNLLNELFTHLSLCAHAALPDQNALPFDQVVKTDPEPDLKCGQLGGSCDIQEDCSQNQSCDPNWGCPDCSCSWSNCDLGCPIRRAGCEADKVRYRTQCEAGKVAAKAACEADKEGKRVACEVAKALAQKNCELQQAWLHVVSDMPVADISGNATLSSGEGELCITNALASGGLSALAVWGTVAASTTVGASFHYQPLNAGYIACQLAWNGDVTVKASAPSQPFELQTDISAVQQAPRSLKLILHTRGKSDIDLKMQPPPALLIPTQTPLVFVVCQPLVVAGIVGAFISGKVRDDLIDPTFPVKIPEFTSDVVVSPATLRIGTQPADLRPEWADKTIRFWLRP